MTVVGARPNFVKMFTLIKAIKKTKHINILVHTGQHYDLNMSDIFFKEMDIKMPDYNLEVGSGLHGEQTGEILKRIEKVILSEEPDVVIVPGDTNTTIGAALAATKLHVKVAHLEAGLRSFDRKMPEEINRILTDHCSDILLCPTDLAVKQLKKEGITTNVHLVGDTMFELAKQMENKVANVKLPEEIPKEYILSTIHRAENTTDEKLPIIMEELMNIDYPIVIPLHPRTKNKLVNLNLLEKLEKHLIIIEPVGFYEFSKLLKDSLAVITDSGGVQKEAYWHKKPCVTVRDSTEWWETINAGGNILSKVNDITNKLKFMMHKEIIFKDDLYGFVDTSDRILKILQETIEEQS
ncbi:MAG TPA: UDP-N-acetylglucosamine 2-epimerase (non-hydrolyzing) [Candidatus Bathyarchaeia archaeon]|nr:UDP-N-acetylglucosamine 2-epimerase (non-hydrolyzing) [Candidatus Bathyarchaeia archaeon]